MVRVAINVDLDRIKFLTSTVLELGGSAASALNHSEFSLDGQKYHSYLAFFSDIHIKPEVEKCVKNLIEFLFSRGYDFRLTGNGVDSRRKVLQDLFGEERFNGLKKHSQVKGITEGLKELSKDIPTHFYRIQGQPLLNLKSIKYSKELEQEPIIEYPLLAISIKGGVSFYRIESPESQPVKVIASILGEFGLAGCLKLIHQDDPNISINQIIAAAFKEGDNLKVDLTVGDIYGDGVSQVAGLHKDIIASSVGKSNQQLANPSKHDYVFSIIAMLCINLGNISSLVVRISNFRE